MEFTFLFNQIHSVYVFAKTIKGSVTYFKYDANSKYVKLYVIEQANLISFYEIPILAQSDVVYDFECQLPTDVFFPKNNNGTIDFVFKDATIKIVTRYEKSTKSKFIQEFSLQSRLPLMLAIDKHDIEDVFASFVLDISELKDIAECMTDGVIIMKIDDELQFELIGRKKRIRRVLTKRKKYEPFTQTFYSKAFNRLKSINLFTYENEKLFQQFECRVFCHNDTFSISLHSLSNVTISINDLDYKVADHIFHLIN